MNLGERKLDERDGVAYGLEGADLGYSCQRAFVVERNLGDGVACGQVEGVDVQEHLAVVEGIDQQLASILQVHLSVWVG